MAPGIRKTGWRAAPSSARIARCVAAEGRQRRLNWRSPNSAINGGVLPKAHPNGSPPTSQYRRSATRIVFLREWDGVAPETPGRDDKSAALNKICRVTDQAG